MIRFDTRAHIARSPDDVFAYLADFRHIPQWNYWVQRVEQLTPGPVGVGTVYQQVRRSDQQRYEVVTFQPGRRVAVRTLPGERPSFHRSLSLTPSAAGGTDVHDQWELDTGHPQLLQRAAAGRIRDAVAGNVGVLRELLEHGRAVLPDGRPVSMV